MMFKRKSTRPLDHQLRVIMLGAELREPKFKDTFFQQEQNLVNRLGRASPPQVQVSALSLVASSAKKLLVGLFYY